MTTGHPADECGEAIAAALNKADAVELLYLSPADKAAAMREFARLSARVDATRLRLMAVAGEVTEEKGDRDVAAWCQRELLVDRGAARRDMTLAGEALEHRWTVLAQEHRSGEVSTAQADVIVRALDDLPDETPSDVRGVRAERVLVEYAATFAPKELRPLGARILDIVAPEVGEEQERKRLEGEERKARRTTAASRPGRTGTGRRRSGSGSPTPPRTGC